MPDIQVNGVRLYYEEHGTGDPILCVHGTGSSAKVWRDAAVEQLAALGRTIVYDRRGCTRSERTQPFEGGLERHTDDAAALLGALDASPAIVIGRSYGGAVAISLAICYPERVRALALLEAFIGSLVPEAQAWESGLAARLDEVASSNEAVARTMYDVAMGEGTWDSFPEELQRMFADNAPAILDEERDPPSIDADHLARIDVPTLVVSAAGSDPTFRRVNDRIAESITGARVAHVEGGHLIDPGHPDVVAFVREMEGEA